MITRQSTVRELCTTPVAQDCMNRILKQAGRSAFTLDNPLIANMKLAAADKLLARRAPGIIDALIALANQHPQCLPRPTTPVQPVWWKEAVVYQIYPRSFQDSNGDGIGDLQGIRQRIPYLKELGVTMVWLCPIYDSPCDDNGYDIRNYRKILHDFGTMRDFNALLKDLHANGIQLMMDLVLNHTSDEHTWFKKALADPAAPERDYYLWAKGQENAPPNNWASFFSGPAWNHYPDADASVENDWALHLFSKKQMDLNWENPALRAEVYDIVNYWVGKGVDAFRLDVINLISKDSFANGNAAVGKATGLTGFEHWFYGPRLHEYLQEMRAKTTAPTSTDTTHEANKALFTVGEVVGCGVEMSRLLTADSRQELDAVFNFDHLDNPGKNKQSVYDFDLRYWKDYFITWQTQYGNDCWPTLLFENHDNPRMISKINPDPAWRPVLSKLLAVLQFTMKGTPFLYQGQEIGMTNCEFTSIDELNDVETVNLYNELVEQGYTPFEALGAVAHGTRDHARTPMQWNGHEVNAGFSEATPWLKTNPNYPAINVENEQKDEHSVLHFYQLLIETRKNSQALLYGDFKPVFINNKNVLCYFRIKDAEKYYIEINLTPEIAKRPGPLTGSHVLLASNYRTTKAFLRPYEANVFKL